MLNLQKVVLAAFFWGLMSLAALADCQNCVEVPNVAYQGGGVQVKTVQATACFDFADQYGQRHILEAISDPASGKTYDFTADFVYRPDKGSYEIVKTVKTGAVCWTHAVPPGTWMAVYVTCPSLGQPFWVAVQVPPAGGRLTMIRQAWGFAEVLP